MLDVRVDCSLILDCLLRLSLCESKAKELARQ